MLSKYGQDEHVTHMMDDMTWMIIPLLNVDGYEYSWTNVSVKNHVIVAFIIISIIDR